ncbi:MAG TPA: condensation domain-containing protein, partial [Thermoanaerobaculia bacterium]
FFALGGHSLLATRVMIRLREKTGIELPVRLVFQAPILAEMAAALAAQQAAGVPAPVAPPLRPLSRDARDSRDGSPLPVSFAQERLWFLDRLAPGSPAYNLPLALRIDGPLDAGALSRALADLVARHESLRTTFPERAGRPVSEICGMAWSGETGGDLPVIDLAPFAAGAEAEARRLAAAEAVRPFDLSRGPLLRTALLRLGRRLGREDRHILLLTIHHIVSDAWSMGVLVGDLTALYAGNELPPLAVQYVDYAAWHRAWLVGDELDRQLGFWRRHLAGATAVLDLPTDRPRPPVQSLRGSRVPVTLSAELSAALAETARAAGATLYMVLLAAWSALLARLSGQDDLVVGTAVANRDRPELERLIGFFVNTLALRADLSGDPAFSILLERARQTVLDAFAHRDLPFEKLVEELHPARDRSRQPIFQVMLTFQNVPPGAVEIPGLTLVPLEIDGETAKFDLTLSLSVEDGRIQGSLEYAADLFDRATVERFLGHLGHLLTAVTAEPGMPLSELPLMGAEEERQLLQVGRVPSGRVWALPATVHELFSQQAGRTPDRTAAMGPLDVLTYGALLERSCALASRIRSVLPRPLDRPVALLAAGSGADPLVLAGMLGILQAGAGFVPLDPRHPKERLAWTLADAGCEVLVAPRRYLEHAAGLGR